MKIATMIMLLTVLVLTGCATTNRVWYHPGKTQAEAEHDFKECQYEAEKYSTGAGAGYQTGFGSGLDIGLKQVRLFRQCMELKGYTLVDKNQIQMTGN
jgi:hypothetical protein